MTISTPADRTALAELSMLINRGKKEDIPKYNMKRIENARKNWSSSKAVKKPHGKVKIQMCDIKEKEGNVH